MSPSRISSTSFLSLLSLLTVAVVAMGCSASFELKPPLARPGNSAGASDPQWHVDDPDAQLRPVVAAAELSAAPTTASSGELNLADAPPIDQVIRATDAQQVEFLRMLQPVSGTAIYFGHILSSDPRRRTPRTIPVIATRKSNGWNALSIGDERALNASWAYIGAGPERGHAWGVLEAPPADPNDAEAHLILLHTIDSGATWRTFPLRKPSPTARYDSICMSPYRGRITLHQPPGENGARSGYFHYYTHDDGATWSLPTFEPDALTPADPVSEADRQRLRRVPPPRAADAK